MSIQKNGIKRKRGYLFEMFEQEWTCPISSYPIIQPVVTSDGHTYEEKQIFKWLQNQKTSPKTGLKLPTLNILPNLALKSVISKFNKQIKYEIDKIVQENKEYQIKIGQLEQKVKNIEDRYQSEKEKNLQLKKIIEKLENRKRETIKETRKIGTQTQTEMKVLRREKQQILKIKKEQGKSTMGVKYQQQDVLYIQQQSGQISDSDDQQLSQNQSQQNSETSQQNSETSQQNSETSQQNSSISQQQNSQSQKQQNSQSQKQKEQHKLRQKEQNNDRQKYRQKQNKPNNNRLIELEDSNRHKNSIKQGQKQILNRFMNMCDQRLKARYQKSLNKKITILPFNSYLLNHPVLYHQKSHQLDHSGIRINLTQFFNHDWSQLKLLNLNSCNVTSKTFKKLAQGLSKGFGNLRTLNLTDNNIVKVSRKTMNKLKYLKKINFADQIQGKMCKSSLSQQSKTILKKFDKDMAKYDSLINKKNGFRCQKILIKQNQRRKQREGYYF